MPASTSFPDGEIEKEGLLDSVLPPPSHPRATRRALSLGVVSVFLVLVVWMASTSSNIQDMESMSGSAVVKQGWLHGDDAVGSSKSKGDAEEDTLHELGSGAEDSEASEIEHDNDSEEDAAELASMDNLAKYLWHQDLEWDADGSGRLIVIGDVHGMVDALK